MCIRILSKASSPEAEVAQGAEVEEVRPADQPELEGFESFINWQ